MHAVYKQTRFSRAFFLLKKVSFTIWSISTKMWANPYRGVPCNQWVDEAKEFLSAKFSTLANDLPEKLFLLPWKETGYSSLSGITIHFFVLSPKFQYITRGAPRSVSFLIMLAWPCITIVDHKRFTPAILGFEAQPCIPVDNYDQKPQSSINRVDLMTSEKRE